MEENLKITQQNLQGKELKYSFICRARLNVPAWFLLSGVKTLGQRCAAAQRRGPDISLGGPHSQCLGVVRDGRKRTQKTTYQLQTTERIQRDLCDLYPANRQTSSSFSELFARASTDFLFFKSSTRHEVPSRGQVTLHLFGHGPELEWVFSLPVRA